MKVVIIINLITTLIYIYLYIYFQNIYIYIYLSNVQRGTVFFIQKVIVNLVPFQ